MPLNCTYSESLGKYIIKNNENFTVNFTIKKVNCEVTSLIKEGVLQANEEKILTFTLDGIYSINFNTEDQTLLLPNILILKDLKNSFITLVEKILCGCSECNECQECTDCEDYLNVYLKAVALNQITFPKYNTSIQTLFNLNSCLFAEEVLLCTKLEKVYGNADIKPLLLQILAYYYLSFYSVDLEQALNQQEENYIIQLYKFEKISKCIRKLGVLNRPIETPSIFNSVFNSIFN